jgi:hypothetical protein
MSCFDSTTSSDCELSTDMLSKDHSESGESSGSFPTSTKIQSRSGQATWEHTQEPQDLEPKHGGKKKELIYYCKYCTSILYSIFVSITFQNHLLKNHLIEAVSQTVHLVKKARTSLLRDVFAKAGQSGVMKPNRREEQVLRSALNPKAIVEALVQLVTV